jgi:hypothetical protein
MYYHNLNINKDTITFQPFFRSKKAVVIYVAIAIIIAVIANVAAWKVDIRYSIYAIAAFLIVYALYIFFIESKTLIEFNKATNMVYKKIPGLFSFKLIAFQHIDNIILIYTNGNPHYNITHKENVFGKSYRITEYFNGCRESKAVQEDFEINILPLILNYTSVHHQVLN